MGGRAWAAAANRNGWRAESKSLLESIGMIGLLKRGSKKSGNRRGNPAGKPNPDFRPSVENLESRTLMNATLKLLPQIFEPGYAAVAVPGQGVWEYASSGVSPVQLTATPAS